MALMNQQKANHNNLQAAKIFSASGTLSDVGGELYTEQGPVNFVISGGLDSSYRNEPLGEFLRTFAGKYPIIILHNGNTSLVELALHSCKCIKRSNQLSVRYARLSETGYGLFAEIYE